MLNVIYVTHEVISFILCSAKQGSEPPYYSLVIKCVQNLTVNCCFSIERCYHPAIKKMKFAAFIQTTFALLGLTIVYQVQSFQNVSNLKLFEAPFSQTTCIS